MSPTPERRPWLENPDPALLERDIPPLPTLELPPILPAREAPRLSTLESVTQHLRAAVTTAAELADLDPTTVLLIP